MLVTNRINIRLRKDKRLMLRLNCMTIETVAGRFMHLRHCTAVRYYENDAATLFCYLKKFDPRTLYGPEIVRCSDRGSKPMLPQNLYLKRSKE